MTKRHLLNPRSTALASACGLVAVDVTEEYTHVTCVLCRKKISALADAGLIEPPTFEIAYVDAIADGHQLDDEPTRIAPFVVDAETWPSVRDGCGCGGCDLCRRWVQILTEDHTDPYRQRLSARASKRSTRWASIGALLESYVAHMADGYPVKGWGGTLELTRLYGTFLQGGEVGTAAPQRAAHDVADAHKVLRSVARDCVVTLPLTTHDGPDTAEVRTMTGPALVSVLLACTVGRIERVSDGARYVQRYTAIPYREVGEVYGLTDKQVRQCVRHAKRYAREVAEQRGLVPAREVAA